MRRIALGLLAAGLVGLSAVAGPRLDCKVLSVTTGTNATYYVATTNTTIKGWIEEITFDVVTAGSTGELWLAASPALTTLSDTYLATNICDADKTFRPPVYGTDVAGAALTNDPPWRYCVIEEHLVFSVTNASATNVTFKCRIKYESGY